MRTWAHGWTKISLKSFKAQMKGYNLARDIASSSGENLILWVYFGGVESDMKQLETNNSSSIQIHQKIDLL